MSRSTGVDPLLEVKDLRKHFPIRKGLFGGPLDYVRAVDGVDLHIAKGQSYGLVGESGCGKTTLVRCILGLIPPSSGRVHFAGKDITALRGKLRRRLRARMQIVFQDPYSSLNPRMPVSRIIGEPLVIHGVGDRRAISLRVRRVLDLVGLKPDHLHRYPHEFSGGQRQRIAIARALVLEPELLVLDEPTSALDVSVQAQILNLLMELQQALGLTYLMISHDLAVIRHMCDTVGVMYAGKVVELSGAETLFSRAVHPYTRVLLATVPRLSQGELGEFGQAQNGTEEELSNAGSLIEMEAGHWVRIADAARPPSASD